MNYALHVAKVVTGLLVAEAMYTSTTSDLYPGRLVLEFLLLIVALGVAVHGLFTGIEAAADGRAEVPDESE